MTENTIISLADDRAEKPDQVKIAQAVNAVAAYSHLCEVQAVAVVALLNGERAYAASYSGLTRAQRMALIGELERLKAALLEGHEFTEILPD